MSKKKQHGTLGKTLIKDRFGPQRHPNQDSFLHTSELNDGYDWGRLNLQSVTEQSTLDEFLATAELAGTDFQAEKMNVQFVTPDRSGLLSKEEEEKVKETQDQYRQLLGIPRRPPWDASTTPEELDQMERDSFLLWRRKLAELQDVEGLILTPFERNLDFWRQLWRVIERSDVIVQIVDGRNPILFYCDDVDTYVKQVDASKVTALLVNKADHLTQKQREYWASYFESIGVRAIFWSASEENERNKARDELEASKLELEAKKLRDIEQGIDEEEFAILSESDSPEEDSSEDEEEDDLEDHIDEHAEKSDSPEKEKSSPQSSQVTSELTHRLKTFDMDSGDDPLQDSVSSSSAGYKASGESADQESSDCDNVESKSSDKKTISFAPSTKDSCSSGEKTESGKLRVSNCADMLTGEELLECFKSLHTGKKHTAGQTTVGLVGYPNVGKSSTINALLQTKKVPVSATPGRTKHFQTLFVEPTLMLCDCPGLVMPTFVSTKAEMVISGILPIDQMRDYIPPVSVVCRHIPRSLLELTYGIMMPPPKVDDGEDPDRLPTAHELLASYALMRGYMTHKGVPDFQRASRYILKDYMNGKLLYCHPPPDMDVDEFQPTPLLPKVVKVKATESKTKAKNEKKPAGYTRMMDQAFFAKPQPRIGTKGVQGAINYTRTSVLNSQYVSSPTDSKSGKKHHNKGKKEKLRRLNRHLDVCETHVYN